MKNTLFKRRFRCRHRRDCLSSQGTTQIKVTEHNFMMFLHVFVYLLACVARAWQIWNADKNLRSGAREVRKSARVLLSLVHRMANLESLTVLSACYADGCLGGRCNKSCSVHGSFKIRDYIYIYNLRIFFRFFSNECFFAVLNSISRGTAAILILGGL